MKKVLKILVLIMIIILIFQINSLYALYKNQLSGVYENSVGNWSIKVNGISINGSEPTELNLFAYETAPQEFVFENHIEEYTDNYGNYGKFYPGKRFYAYLEIDPQNTDVAVMYDINIDFTDEKIENFRVISIENYFTENGNIINDDYGNTLYNENQKNIDFENYDSSSISYRAMIPLERITNNQKNMVKICFEWYGDDLEKNLVSVQNVWNYMLENNFENDKFSIPVEITFKQYVGDEIDE